MTIELPKLPYGYDALAPHVGKATLELHHGKHHKAYVDNANKALEGTKWADMPVEQVVKQLAEIPENIRTAVRNNAGGHANHSMFWKIMAPAGKGGGGEPKGPLMEAIKAAYGDFAHFKEEFAKAATTRFGSGWAWLVLDGGELKITSTPNQDSPLTDGQTPLLGNDVWEHAYYLKYQNRRPEYLKAWWNVVDWSVVAGRYAAARG